MVVVRVGVALLVSVGEAEQDGEALRVEVVVGESVVTG